MRGGFGVNYAIRLRRGHARASMVMDHGRTGPLGALGGADGGVNQVAIERGAEIYRPLHLSKDQDIQLSPGDVVRVSTPGGGGYGDPFQRDPARVARDVARSYYTRSQAQTLFGVALDAEGGVDAIGTAALRRRDVPSKR